MKTTSLRMFGAFLVLGVQCVLVPGSWADDARDCSGPLAVCPPAALAAIPRIHKMTIYDSSVPTVHYFVQGGSPQLEALCKTLEATENKLGLAKASQKGSPGSARDDTSALADELTKLREQVQAMLRAEQAKTAAEGCGAPVPGLCAQPAAPFAVSPQCPAPLDPVAFQQMLRQQILPRRQQLVRRHR